jgi:hypothetical protein
MGKVGIVNGHLEYIPTIWYILSVFGNFMAISYVFSHFGIW